MNFENLEVKHKVFGNGVILSKQGKYITVRFETATKTFVYPDAFEKFLSFVDPTVDPQLAAELAASNAEKQAIEEKKRQENRRAMERGIVIPGKENLPEGDDEEGRYKSDVEDI